MPPLDDGVSFQKTPIPLLTSAVDHHAHRPLNQDRPFAVWPAFAPGEAVDTNPAFVRLADGAAWAVFTRYAAPPQPGTGSLWAVPVDDAWLPAGQPQLLIPFGMDARLIRLRDRVLLFYVRIEHAEDGRIAGCGVVLAEYGVSNDTWVMLEAFQLPKQPIQREPGPDTLPGWEKNWVPFVIDDDRVGLIYAHDPWDVLVLHAAQGEPRRLEAAFTSTPLQWDYGTIRGGTPPVPYDDGHLITFFHASQQMGSSNVYSVGACVLQAKPPYAPVLMTSEPLLIAPYGTNASRFGWTFRGSVVFPLGCEAHGDRFNLLCGRDDGEIAAFAVPRDELAARLRPVAIKQPGRVCDYRGGPGVALPATRLLYVPNMIPGIPELPMINLLRVLVGRGRRFVDVGAHIGFYTIGLAPQFDTVVAYEPSRAQHTWLAHNVRLNGYAHVEVNQVALGDAPGTAPLHVLSYEGGLNSLAPDVASRYQAIDHYDVPVAVLDDRGLTDVDLLKIDVEGYELPVLRGAARTITASRPLILLEVWQEPARRRDVRAQMDAFDYTLEFLFPASPELALCIPRERRAQYKWFL
ncbi:MAG: FkbM family methyltransferase [Acetobacteraceae bacterium]|nr:FkbM family methyltransferase [Pseudomonadota bacterium]